MVKNNPYIEVIDHIVAGFRNITKYMMAFGMGALTTPKQKSASDIFALSGDIFNPFILNEDLVSMYSEAFSKIQVSSPVNYAPIMELISKYAQYESENYEWRNYFNLIYITPGVLDDYNNTFDRLK